MQMSYLYASDFPFKTFAKSLNIQRQYEKNVWEKSNDAYSLSIRVQTKINQFLRFYVSYDNINVQENVFFQSASWERHCATHWREQRGWDLVIFIGSFWACACKLSCTLSCTILSPARVQPLYGAGRKESSGTGLTDEGHSPETSGHLVLTFWHFHFIITFVYCSNKCHAAYEAFLASHRYMTIIPWDRVGYEVIK